MLAAKVISLVFNPLSWPMIIYLVIFLMGKDLLPGVINSWVLWSLIASGSFLVPVFMILTLRNSGLLSSISMENKQERRLPMFLTSILYLGLSWMLFQKTPELIHLSFLGISLVLLISTLITLAWKISIHAIAGAGSSFFLILLGIFENLPDLVGIGIGLLLLTGLIGWSRLKLDAHTVPQVLAGLFLGIFSSFGVLLIF